MSKVGPPSLTVSAPMRRTAVLPLALLAVTACARDPIRTLAAPAPAGALECARQELARRGYEERDGGREYGYVSFDRGRDTPTADLLDVHERDGTLTVDARTRDPRNRVRPPEARTLADAQAVLDRCATGGTNRNRAAGPRAQ